MKRNLLIIFLVMVFSFYGAQPLFCQVGDTAARGAGITREALPEELQDLDIKDYFIISDAKEAGVIQTMIGHVVVIHEDSGEAYFAAPGDKIFEKDTIFTLKESRCRLKFLGDNIITMGDKTKISIKEFIADLELKEKRSVFSMVRGKAMFYALKLFKYRKASILVETPTAVAGVRGTKFGVEIKEEHSGLTASHPVYLADASKTGWVRLAQAGNDGSTTIGSYTVVYSFDGTVTVTSTVTGESVTLSAGEFVNMFTIGAGEVSPTPEDISKLFQDDTSAPEGDEGDEADEGDEGAGDDDGAGDDGGTDDGGTDTDDTTTSTDVTQTQSTKKEDEKVITDPVTDPETNATGTEVGYFSGILSNYTNSQLEELFVSTKRQDFDGSNIWARGSKNTSSDYLRADPGTGLSAAYAKWAMFDSGSKNSGDLGTDHPVSHTILGEVSSILEWGYWTMPTKFTVDSVDYLVDNRGYYIFGDDTASMPSTSTATYSGNACGTYWSSGGGVNMGPSDYVSGGTGTFGCDVNFSTAAISDFDLSVSGGGKSASIADATGTFTSSAYFTISGGTWNLNGNTPDDKMCYGSFYGSDADYIGGAWGMYHTSSNTGAAGIFKGDKGSVAPVNHYGYLTGMLERYGSKMYVTTYISTTRQDFDSANAVAVDTSGGESYVNINGITSPMRVTFLSTPSGHSWTGSKNVIQPEVPNHNEYMEWGYWTQPNAMTADSHDYFFANRGYYVWGDYTENMPTTGTATYSGNAYGTFWTHTGGDNMTGSFNAAVNFAASSNQITEFDMSVTGTNNSASIADATGTLSSSHFSLSGGTWKLGPPNNEMSASSKSAYGSFYGPNAAAIGGVWQMGYGGSSGYHAVGSFAGNKQ